MTTTNAGMRGHAPTVLITPPSSTPLVDVKSDPPTVIVEPSQEQMRKLVEASMPTYEEAKYTKCWNLPQYRKFSPGEHLVDMFLEAAGEIAEGATIIDWGCGTGRASKKLYEAGFDVTMVDFAENCLDPEVAELAKGNSRLRFRKFDLTQKSDFTSDYGFCTDVMEHIPPDDVHDVMSNILLSSKHVFFQISTQEDGFGKHPEIGDDLHLSVHGYFWWLERFLKQACVILRSQDTLNTCIFYVTGYGQHQFRWSDAKVNIPPEESHRHMIDNAKLGIQHVMPHQPQDTEVVLVCGGPTTLGFKDEIIAKRESGMPLITVNGTYKFMLDWGLKPSLQCMIDGREFNNKFVYQVPGYTDDCKYIISSHCHPSVFTGLPKERTYIWSVSLSKEDIEVAKEHYGEMYKDFFPCPGGSTVALRTLCLLRMLGFNKIHIYGLDSCNFPNKGHHAYEQPENDNGKMTEMVVGRGTEHEKTFMCETWHVYQAREFLAMIPRVLSDCDLAIYGDGLLAYMIESAATLDDDTLS